MTQNIQTRRAMTSSRRGRRATNFHSAAAALSVAVMLGVSLNGCVGVVVGAGATVGTAAMEERGILTVADDTALRLRLNSLLSAKDERLWRKVGMQVYMGRVLLTGTVETQAMRAEAIRLSWAAKGVKEVINELKIGDYGSASDFARDAWILTQLKSVLLFDKKISSINYLIKAASGTVYLIGLAQDRAELDRVINHARRLPYVKKVVNYVQIKRPPSSI